ncbi:MAG: hypothetical protein FJ128_08030 [Deltaproteobacteria bacterium]|nr:hypothetical protein [Deltaproteobacteria bacterium]
MRLRRFFLLLGLLSASLTVNLLWAHQGLANEALSPPKITIINHSGYPDTNIYLIVTGRVGANYHHLDWATGEFPECSADDNTVPVAGQSDLYADYFTTLSSIKQPDGTYSFPIHQMEGGRVWLSFDKPVYLHINSATAIREPSTDTTADPNYQTRFDKLEITYNALGVTTNTTCVDFFCMPLVFELKDNGASLGIRGMNRYQQSVVQALAADSMLKSLVTPYRVLAPKTTNPSYQSYVPSNYFQPYVDYIWTNCWQDPGSLQVAAGGYNWTGQISGDVLTMTVDGLGEVHPINKPTNSLDIFACAGVFNIDTVTFTEGEARKRDGAIKNEIVSALNRTVMHLATSEWDNRNRYYQKNGLSDAHYRTNIYSKILHDLAIDKRIYGFPYDEKGEAAKLENQPATDIILTINNCKGALSPAPFLLMLLGE